MNLQVLMASRRLVRVVRLRAGCTVEVGVLIRVGSRWFRLKRHLRRIDVIALVLCRADIRGITFDSNCFVWEQVNKFVSGTSHFEDKNKKQKILKLMVSGIEKKPDYEAKILISHAKEVFRCKMGPKMLAGALPCFRSCKVTVRNDSTSDSLRPVSCDS